VIGRDGHILLLRVVSSPDPSLAVSAIAAVRQWNYRPYMLNGVPVEVETTINVNFTVSP
jgi:protein TonB